VWRAAAAETQYVDHLFPGFEYRKLPLHFRVNDISFSEGSVDARMAGEL
jgi:hypothetical protein